MKIKHFFFIYFLSIAFFAVAQSPTHNKAVTQKVQWLTIEQAVELQKVQKKKIIVDVYTSWCGWCKYMEQTTFQQQNIVNYLNNNFYAVKFDAEQKNDIRFKDKNYHYITKGSTGIHEFALEMMNGMIAPPALVILDENMNVIQPMEGFQNPEKFEAVLNYFANNLHKKIPWSKYEQQMLKNHTAPKSNKN